MRILLDNCVDVRASRLFVAIPEVEVLHARDMGWSAYANGRLLAAAAAAGFSVFVTTDQNIRYQQKSREAAAARD